MEPSFQTTSFIPKKPLTEDRTGGGFSSGGLFMVIAVVLFLASVGGAGGVFLYKKSLQATVLADQATLKKAKDAFEPETIATFKLLDRRITASGTLLQNHVTVSPIFNVLNTLTLKRVQFTKFNYSLDGVGASAKVQVQMGGKADSFKTLALQSDKLTESKYITDPIFSNLNLDKDGNVLFDLSFSVDPRLVLFSEVSKQKSISSTPVPVDTQPVDQPTTSTGSDQPVTSQPTPTPGVGTPQVK